MPKGICAHCGEHPARLRSPYCGDECKAAAKAARRRAVRRLGKSLTCEVCGASVAHRRSDARWCSAECSNRGEYLDNQEAIKARVALWRRDNPAAAKARDSAYGKRNRRRIMARQAMWVEANREHHESYQREYQRRWNRVNRERTRAYKHARRAREHGVDSVGVLPRDWRRLVNRYGGRCAYCDAKPDALHMDHVIPLARGGRHAIGNVLPACQRCNQTKSARLLIEWRLGRSALRRAA